MSDFRMRGRWSSYRPVLGGGFGSIPPVIKWLLIVNTGLWLLLGVLLRPFTYRGVPLFLALEEYLMLWPAGAYFWPWQPLTYMFLHGGFLHLFFNMLMLWMFGAELETLWGSRRFLLYYILCGLGAAAANLLIAPLVDQAGPTVGASGAIYGVLIAFGMLFPDRPIYVYFLLPVRAKYLIAIFIGLELFYGVTGTTDGIAHFAHLGGAATGLALLVMDRAGVRLPQLRWPWGKSPSGQASRFSRPAVTVQDARFTDVTDEESQESGSRTTQEIIDAILDKIGREGYQNLTDEEKRILNEASKQIH